MPTIRDTAVCLRHWDFSETSQTVSLFTREHGVVRGLAKGAKRERGSFSGGIDVLTRGEVVAIVKRGRDLATLTAWHLQETYRVLRRDLDANRAAFYMADLVHNMLTDHDPHPRLFDALCAGLRALATTKTIPAALLGVQWAVLEECGYRPELRCDVETGAALDEETGPLTFDAHAGGLVAGEGQGRGWRVRVETIALLREVAAAADVAGGDPVVHGRANRLLAAYCREIIGREIPSLRWAFSDLSDTNPGRGS
jgi:DNA repair protein RecO (recombination protein O)